MMILIKIKIIIVLYVLSRPYSVKGCVAYKSESGIVQDKYHINKQIGYTNFLFRNAMAKAVPDTLIIPIINEVNKIYIIFISNGCVTLKE